MRHGVNSIGFCKPSVFRSSQTNKRTNKRKCKLNKPSLQSSLQPSLRLNI